MDELFGEYTGPVDDLVLRRGDGVVAYNLAVVLDDAAQGVDQVVRGDDLLASAPRQSYLAHLLGPTRGQLRPRPARAQCAGFPVGEAGRRRHPHRPARPGSHAGGRADRARGVPGARRTWGGRFAAGAVAAVRSRPAAAAAVDRRSHELVSCRLVAAIAVLVGCPGDRLHHRSPPVRRPADEIGPVYANPGSKIFRSSWPCSAACC